MGQEIERKFLVAGEGWRGAVSNSFEIAQAYLAKTGKVSVRVRVRDERIAFITIKSAEPGMSRAEYEYEIPVADGLELLERAETPVLVKRRHEVILDGLKWEVDVFGGRHEGLMIAEVELASEDQQFARPDWLGDEVTGEQRYYNESLARG